MQPTPQPPPCAGFCRVWAHTPRASKLSLLGDYFESRASRAAAAAFDQVESKSPRTFIVQDARGQFTAWDVRLEAEPTP